jgi:hypothetical protein
MVKEDDNALLVDLRIVILDDNALELELMTVTDEFKICEDAFCNVTLELNALDEDLRMLKEDEVALLADSRRVKLVLSCL